MDYGPFESLGHEGYSDKVAAEKREETLDRAAARVMENVGDYFRNASNRADFNQRWDFAQKDVRHFVGIEAATTDETMAEVRKRVASLTFSDRNKTSSLSWEDGAPGFDTDGNRYSTIRSKGSSGTLYVIAPDDEGTYILSAIQDSNSTILADGSPEQECKEIAEEYEQTKTGHRASHRKQAAQWENADHGAQRIEFPPGYWYRVQETFRGDFEVTYNDTDGTPWTMGPYSTMEEAKAESIADAKSRGVYREAKKVAEDYAANHTARRRQAALHWDEVDPKSAYGIDGPVDYYASLGPNVGQYSIREDSDGTFTAYFDNFGSIGIIKSGIATLEEAKSICESHFSVNDIGAGLNPSHVSRRRESRRKRASGELNWIAEEGFEFAGWNAALPGTAPEDEIGYSILEMDGRYSVYYSNEPQGEEETLADGSITSLEEAKALAEGHYQSHKTARTARRRKQSWAIADDGMTYTSTQVQDSFDCPTCGSGNKLGFSRCACGKQWNSYSINDKDGKQKMIAREVEARPEAILASRRRQARRKRANAEEQVNALGLKSADGLVGQDGSQYIDNQGRVLNLYLQGDDYAELVDADNNTIVVDFENSDEAVNALRGVTAKVSRRKRANKFTDINPADLPKGEPVIQWTDQADASGGGWNFTGVDQYGYKYELWNVSGSRWDGQELNMGGGIEEEYSSNSRDEVEEWLRSKGMAKAHAGVTARRNKPDLEFIAGWKAAERDRPLRRGVSSEAVAGYRAYRKAHVTRR